MNAINRLDRLLTDAFKIPSIDFSEEICQETSVQPSIELTFAERESYPSTVLPLALNNTAPLPPRRNASSIKHHRQRYQINPADKQKTDQPLLNSSTLDDLFRALTLECEQCLADTPSSYQNKIYEEIMVQSSSDKQAAIESNDDDYENLHPPRPAQTIKTSVSPLKTSIEVISPIKRHVVSITVSSKVTSIPPPLPLLPIPPPPILSSIVIPPTKPSPSSPSPPPPPIPPAPPICRSSDEEPANLSSSSTNRKRRRRTRKQFVSLSTTRSSSSSTERKAKSTERKSLPCRRSNSIDPRHHRSRNSSDNRPVSYSSSYKQCPKRPHRRDVSLQHPERYHEKKSLPLSVLLTSTKPTSDFIGNSQQRRSRLESVDHKPPALFYRPSSTRNNHNNNNNQHLNKSKNNSNIPTHRIPSYPVY
ncbi:unnamed protein product [Adineta ricciae]|uniref:Uncharacterized protein n=1 Tax=Adineta ricciae TaxID=249248 RepID=A0A813VNL8_ADIRI|nr:unnamed protein product [Adineta ricciae]